jgi:hypothetical protein
MKLKLSFSILPLTFVAATAAGDYENHSTKHHSGITSTIVTNTPIPCIVGGYSPCPLGSICTQTMTCGGLCASVFTPPPAIPCPTVGKTDGCPTGSSCTETTACVTRASCGGQCIATPPPAISCTPGVSSNCPTGSTCMPTFTPCPAASSCGGQCYATPPPNPYTVPCVNGGSPCGPNSICSGTETCKGQCIGTPSPSTRHSQSTSSRHHHKSDHSYDDGSHQ